MFHVKHQAPQPAGTQAIPGRRQPGVSPARDAREVHDGSPLPRLCSVRRGQSQHAFGHAPRPLPGQDTVPSPRPVQSVPRRVVVSPSPSLGRPPTWWPPHTPPSITSTYLPMTSSTDVGTSLQPQSPPTSSRRSAVQQEPEPTGAGQWDLVHLRSPAGGSHRPFDDPVDAPPPPRAYETRHPRSPMLKTGAMQALVVANPESCRRSPHARRWTLELHRTLPVPFEEASRPSPI